MAQNKLLATLSKISLGLVIVLVWAFMWIRADILFPVNTEVWRLTYILTFILLLTFVFAWDTIRGSRTEKDLFRVSFLKEFPKFLLSAGLTIVVLYVVGTIFKPEALNTVSQAIGAVTIGVVVLHAFMISIGEELIFRGWVPERLAERGIKPTNIILISSVVFALFHAGMGRSIITLLIYIPLGLLFHTIKRRFSPRTNMANAGVHFGYNLFLLAILMA